MPDDFSVMEDDWKERLEDMRSRSLLREFYELKQELKSINEKVSAVSRLLQEREHDPRR